MCHGFGMAAVAANSPFESAATAKHHGFSRSHPPNGVPAFLVGGSLAGLLPFKRLLPCFFYSSEQFMSLQLYVIAGPDKDRAFALREGADLMLGRGTQSAYQVTDPTVSRSHCQLLCESDRVTVICKGGSAGTLVNGKKIQKQTLKPGDVLQIGATQLRFQLEDAAGAATISGI